MNGEVRTAIKNIFPEMIKRIRLHPESESDLQVLIQSHDIKDFIKRKLGEYFTIPLGKWFNFAFKEQRINFDNLNFKESQTMLLAMEHLQTQFFPNGYPSGDLESDEQWVCVKCALCQKKVYVKNGNKINFVTFFLQVIYPV